MMVSSADPSGHYISLQVVFIMGYNHPSGTAGWLIKIMESHEEEESNMADEITPELFNHLVELAALELEPAEAEYLRGQLNNQLKAIRELASIQLDNSLPVAPHGVPYTPEISPPARPDEWEPYPSPARLLEAAPETEHGYIVAPEIPHEELS
jgi:aspartyl/glutamyl-tRNA(Asn/Gln) amidotransferase C subunit